MSTNRLNELELPEVYRRANHSEPSTVSCFGLCSSSFFLAEANGVTIPFVNTFLIDKAWSYEAIGAMTALVGMVRWLMQVPIGLLIDAARRYQRELLAGATLIIGACVGLLPFLSSSAFAVGLLLVAASLAKQPFSPLTNALALELVRHDRLGYTVGLKQCWNHVGNIVAALIAMAIVSQLSVEAMFLSVAFVSMLAAVSVKFNRPEELVDRRLSDSTSTQPLIGIVELLRHQQVLPLLIATALFHLANAPVMPLVAQKVRFVAGTNDRSPHWSSSLNRS